HLLGKDMDSTEWYRKVSNAFEDIYRLGRALGGVISGEHGLGFEKTGYLRISTDNEVLGLMKQIKRAFDPNNILNPGKILDLE
ncbi:FAD-linked oxidase C-terminal domain-containing protein, partial [Chloroflexota bacterium]